MENEKNLENNLLEELDLNQVSGGALKFDKNHSPVGATCDYCGRKMTAKNLLTDWKQGFAVTMHGVEQLICGVCAEKMKKISKDIPIMATFGEMMEGKIK